MLNNAVLTKVKTTYTPDGQGGYTIETVEEGTYDVQLSISDNVEEATAYGVSVEEVLKVVSDLPLLDEEAGLYILKGQDGADGKDGVVDFSKLTPEQKEEIIKQLGMVSPTIEVEKADTVTTLTITDVKGVKTATINDGTQGAAGPQGEKGDKGDTGAQGPQGEQGIQGETGAQGKQGVTFTPSVGASDGKYFMKWSNDGGLDNPSTVYWYNGSKGDKGDAGTTPNITVTADVDNTSLAQPTVTVTKTGTDESPAFNLSFVGLKGASGSGGTSDVDIDMTATVDVTTGTPTVSVLKNIAEDGTFQFGLLFGGLKGEKGAQGEQGPAYTLTEADLNTIVTAVLENMVNAEGVEY